MKTSMKNFSEYQKEAYKQGKFIIDLNMEDASKEEDTLVWNIEISNPGKYDLQILSEKKYLKGQYPEYRWQADQRVRIRFIDIEQEVILNPDIEFELAGEPKPIMISHISLEKRIETSGSYKVFLKTDVDTLLLIRKLRLVPLHNFCFGTNDKYMGNFEKMAAAEAKQNALKRYNDSKYGMFIHWGLYSMLGGEYKGRRMEDMTGPSVAEWIMRNASIDRNEYRLLAQDFYPHKNAAKEWVKLAKAAGMKYVVLTSKHHDGFSLWDSDASDFNIAKMTPYARDFLDDLYFACEEEEVEFALYHSHGADWMDNGIDRYFEKQEVFEKLEIKTKTRNANLSDPSFNSYDDYVQKKLMPQLTELLQRYPKMKQFWFDGRQLLSETESYNIYKLIYDMNPSVLVNSRLGYGYHDYVSAGDNEIPENKGGLKTYWDTCGTTNDSWGFKHYDHNFKSSLVILSWLIEITSKGGNYLLNVGPDGDGNVPLPCTEALREVGSWLEINGEAIYGSSNYKINREGPNQVRAHKTGQKTLEKFSEKDFWFTKQKGCLYTIALQYPSGPCVITSLGNENIDIKDVTLVGSSEIIKWTQSKNHLEFELPDVRPHKLGYVMKIELKPVP